MPSLVEQLAEWEAEEREHRARTAMRQPEPTVQAAAPTVSPAGSNSRSSAFVQDAPPPRTPEAEAAAAPPRTPRSAGRLPLAEHGALMSQRRRLMWEAEVQAKEASAAVRPRQCTTPRERLGGMSASASTGSLRPASGTHSSPEDRAVRASLGLAYMDNEIFFKADGSVLRRTSPPSSKPTTPRSNAKAHWSTTKGRGLRTPRPATATDEKPKPWL
jgi:hypothetical protein